MELPQNASTAQICLQGIRIFHDSNILEGSFITADASIEGEVVKSAGPRTFERRHVFANLGLGHANRCL